MADMDSLVPQGEMQKDPYRAKGSDFPVKSVSAFTGQSGSHGTAEGKDQLVADSENQCGPRHVEDDGPGSSGAGTPTGWQSGSRSGRVASNFSVSKNGAGEGGTGMDAGVSVDLATGKITASGYKSTKVGEVGDRHAHIPSR